MKYQHTTAYWIKGLIQHQVESGKEIVLNTKIGFRAVLTSSPDVHCFEGDRSLADSVLRLGRWYGLGEPGSLEEQLIDKTKEIQESRKQKFGSGLYIVCLIEGNIDKFEPSYVTETDNFVICSDGVSKESIESINLASKSHILDMLSALTLSTDSVLAFAKASESLVFFRDDGKPVYFRTLSGSARTYACPLITPETVKSAEDWYQKLTANQDLDRVKQLLVSSLQTEDDKLRSFLSAWVALEIFINKTFVLYEEQFFQKVKGGYLPKILPRFLNRIREVTEVPKNNYPWNTTEPLTVLIDHSASIREDMKGNKYRVADKFALIASWLSLEAAEEDVKEFMKAKEKRDDLSHIQDLVEAALPVKGVQKLVRKYLQLHLTA